MKLNKYCTLLVRDRSIEYDKTLDNPENIADILVQSFHADQLPAEHVWEICLNNKLDAVGLFEISIGTAKFTLIDLPAIVRNALLTGAVAVIIAHNHPSGSTEVSPDDKSITKRIQDALALFDIELLDHIIVTPNAFVSMHELGLIEKPNGQKLLDFQPKTM